MLQPHVSALLRYYWECPIASGQKTSRRIHPDLIRAMHALVWMSALLHRMPSSPLSTWLLAMPYLPPPHTFCTSVLASDGLWAFATDQDVVDAVREVLEEVRCNKIPGMVDYRAGGSQSDME